MSGGEQQMLVIGRALMAKPTLLLLDEPSLGIAPKLVQDIARSIVAINRDEKVSVLLVEQNSRMALAHLAARLCADHRRGRAVRDVPPSCSATSASSSSISAANFEGAIVMRILVINPNTTASMTRKIGVAAARGRARRDRDRRRQSELRPAEHRGLLSTRPSAVPGLIAEIAQGAGDGRLCRSPASTIPGSTPRAASPRRR